MVVYCQKKIKIASRNKTNMDSDSEPGLSDLSRKCLNRGENNKKDESLSFLTAKYKSKNLNNIFMGDAIASKIVFEKGFSSFQKNSSDVSDQQEKVRRLSSSEDDDSDIEISGFSLAALAAKHNKKSQHNREHQQTMSCNLREANLKNSSDSEISDSESPMSLVALAAKHKSTKAKNIEENLTGTGMIAEDKKQTSKGFKLNSAEDLAAKCRNEAGESTVLAQKLLKVTLTADAIEDNPDLSHSLFGVACQHSTNVQGEKPGSLEDLLARSLKPKEILRVANSGRQHSKSESDQSATAAQMNSQFLVNSGFENEMSTSLKSLKDVNSSNREFEFSLGCNIPNSFKSINLGSTSSLGSLQGSRVNVNNSFSDPDVSLNSRTLIDSVSQKCFGVPRSSIPNPSFPVNEGDFGGINLSCAIKSSSNTGNIVVTENISDVDSEPMEEEIVTLLDNLIIDDDTLGDETITKKKCFVLEVKDDCCLDLSHILLVKMKLRTSKCSSFGKVVCKKWRSQHMPYVKNEKLKSSVIPFTFNSPSPDDVIAGFLERRPNGTTVEN